MGRFPAIQLNAFLFLIVFTANLCAVCHCRHEAFAAGHGKTAGVVRGVVGERGCCEKMNGMEVDARDEKPAPACPGKDGCGGKSGILFGLLDKQVSGNIALKPLFPVEFTYCFTQAASTLPVSKTSAIVLPGRWLYKHSPPDLQAFYQQLRI